MWITAIVDCIQLTAGKPLVTQSLNLSFLASFFIIPEIYVVSIHIIPSVPWNRFWMNR